MPTYTRTIIAVMGPAYSGQAANIGVAVKDTAGTIIPGASVGLIAEVGTSGSYAAALTLPAATANGRLEWTIAGQPSSVAAVEDFGPRPSGDITGQLPANGLDLISIADVTGDADARGTFPKLVRAIFNRFYNAVSVTGSQQTVANDTGAVVSTMPVSDNGTIAGKGKSS